jgi:acetylornithine deacetylase
MTSSGTERILRYLDQHPNRVVEITQKLVQADTVFMGPGTPARQEKQCQEWIASFLTELGCTVDQWEPDPADFQDHPMYQQRLRWEERPITVGVLPGTGGGKSLILNGHIDTVTAEPLDRWTRSPWGAEVEGDRLYGRGAADMKGGIAAFLAVAEAVVRSGIKLRGDLMLQTVTDEETTGMGTVAAIQRGYRADACLVPEPSNFEIWVAYRGILYANIRVDGRPAHAEIPQPHWRAGGGVNAIDLMRKVMDGLDALSMEWQGRPDKQHALLATPRIFPTGISGGEFIASLPARCELQIDLTYLPANGDALGYGSAIRQEVEDHLARWAAADPWLRENPPRITWIQDYPAAETSPDHEFVQALSVAGREEGIKTRIGGLNSWADVASYLLAGVPSLCFGTGSIERAHTIDEWVSITELRRLSRVLARLVGGWCGAQE